MTAATGSHWLWPCSSPPSPASSPSSPPPASWCGAGSGRCGGPDGARGWVDHAPSSLELEVANEFLSCGGLGGERRRYRTALLWLGPVADGKERDGRTRCRARRARAGDRTWAVLCRPDRRPEDTSAVHGVLPGRSRSPALYRD